MSLRLAIFLVPAVISQLSAQDERALFSTHCAVCHGDGHGTERGPNLVANRKVRAADNAQLREIIRNGVTSAGMPAFNNLPGAALDQLTELVRAFNASAADTAVPGDRAAGERFFFGAGGCAKCHMAGGRGRAIGPDLSAVGRNHSLASLEEALRNPAASIKPGYELVRVTLRSGGPLRGFARNRSRFSAQIQDLEGKLHLLDASEISSLTPEPGSLMAPVRCSPAECGNLLAYLASLTGPVAGKPAHAFASPATAPKPGDWPTYHGLATGNRHSPLAQVTRDNVGSLRLAWLFPIRHDVIEATPLVADGVMYVTGPNQVFALDARSGRTIWHYQRPRSRETRGDPAKGTNRGAAVAGDRVFFVTDNAHLVALHRLTGEPLWESVIPEGMKGRNFGNTSAPLAVNDLVIAGISGGDLGMRGFLSAYKASTGERIWRLWTTPLPGEPLSETWRGSALADFGGGAATWMTGTFDAETQTLYWGTGNPYPALNGDERGGDNLYSDSVLAIDPATGKLKWHYQFTPHDLYDWDAGQTPMILNTTFRGHERKLLATANRNGFFYVFDRVTGELLLGEKFVDRLTWATGIGKDGRPILIPGQEPTRDGKKVCPNILGGTNWHSVAFNPETRHFYLNAREACGIYVKPPSWNPRPIPNEPGQMFLRALDIETGRRVWETPHQGPADSWGGVLSTAGGLVFFGEDSGAFAAADNRDGKVLWQIQTNAAAELGDGHSWRASPMTYTAAGKQYVAVAAGPNILVFSLP